MHSPTLFTPLPRLCTLTAIMEAIYPVAPVRVADNHCTCPRFTEDSYPGCLPCSTEKRKHDHLRQRDSRGPSAFIPLTQLLDPDLEDNIASVMGFHPEYLAIFWKTQHQLLRMDGALSYPERHYLAIMAAARHRCLYLVSLHSSCFLQVGGDPHWLEGLICAPLKLRKLNDLNKLLAHRPWLITKEHIQSLLRSRKGHNWSLAELMHALVLLTHFHSLSSFILGCGIYPIEGLEGISRPPSPDIATNEEGSPPLEAERILDQMRQLDEEDEEASQAEMESRFEREKTDAVATLNGGNTHFACSASTLCFLEDPDFGYIDFTRRGEQPPPTFHAHDYTWEDHGYSLLHRLYPEIGQLLDDKFQVAYNLTYHTIATHHGVDTSKLRRAIWNYIQCIFGIRYDDYDYREVNQLLERRVKVYMKMVACYPEKVTRHMYLDFWRQFKHSEKVHLNLLLLEARLQAALLYCLRAITHYMT